MSDAALGWRAEPVPPERRDEVLRDQESFEAIDVKRRRSFSRLLIADSILTKLICVALASVLTIRIYREKPLDKEYITVDSSTGYVGEAYGSRDAPRTFNARVAMADIEKYIDNRLAYLPERDQEQWNVVRAMSTKDCFGIYDADRKKPDAPVKSLGQTGHVLIYNYTDDLHPVHNKDGSWSYSVRFNRQEVKGMTIGTIEHWQADITFAWHPDMTMTTPDEHRNYTGFQCIAFDARRMS